MDSIIKTISNYFFGDPSFVKFQHDWMLTLGFIAIVLFSILFFVTQKVTQKKLSAFSELNMFQKLTPNRSKNRPYIKFIIWSLALLLFTFAAANPQLGTKKQEVKRAGIDLMICLDVSKSMLAEDIKPNRLKRAKHAISNIINQLGSDRIGLIVFAGDAYLQLPLTSDHSAAKMYLENISVDMIPVPGTSLSRAIEKSIESFPLDQPTNKAIIVITDGENHDEEALSKATEANNEGIQIFTLGMGSTKGSTIPLKRGNTTVGMLKDKNGSTVISRLNETILEEIADNGGGKYYLANNQNIGLDYLFNEINKIEKTEYESTEFTDYESKYQIFLILGICLLVLENLIFDRKGKWLQSVF